VVAPRFEVTVSEPGVIDVDFTGDGTSDVQQLVDEAGIYAFPSSIQADGPHTVTATLTPLVGAAVTASVLVTIDTQGPKLSSGPSVAAAPASQRTLVFSESLDPASVASGAFSLSVPDITGSAPATGVSGSAQTWTVSFDPLASAGKYTLTVQPAVQDLAGNPLNQDGNATNGEPEQDAAQDTFTVLVGATSLTTATTISASNLTYENQDLVVDGATRTINGEHVLAGFHVINGGKVTHAAANTAGMRLTVNGDVGVDLGASITADGTGYGSQQGPGAGGGGSWNGGGGGYGGVGGAWDGPGGATYGAALEPASLGSGGGHGQDGVVGVVRSACSFRGT
jgi:hypothetical protein